MKHLIYPKLEKVLQRISGIQRQHLTPNQQPLSDRARISSVAQAIGWETEPLSRLTAQHYCLPYVPDIPPPPPHANLSSFPLFVLKRENFIVTDREPGRITIVCSDPSRVPRLRLWREGYRISLYIAPPEVIARSLDILEELVSGSSSPSVAPEVQQVGWQCFDEIVANVLSFEVTLFEISYHKTNCYYGFVDKVLTPHRAKLEYQLCTDMIETLHVAYQEGVFIRQINSGLIGCELTFFQASKTLIVNLRILEDYPPTEREQDDLSDLFEKPSMTENKGQIIKFPARSDNEEEDFKELKVVY